MAFTYPTTRVANEIIDATDWNTDLTDSLAWLGKDKPHCRVYNSANQSVATATFTTITHNSERFDVGGMHSTVTNTSRITIPTGGGGRYLIGAGLFWAANATGQRAITILLNGTTRIVYDNRAAVAAVESVHQVTTLYNLAAGDYIEMSVYQNSGGNLNATVAANYASEFWCMWMAAA